ncbi:MAG TPA: levanase, partial [Chitinophagaceae bacterium]|nr:levanase [Chitinophagaceae bacterium]
MKKFKILIAVLITALSLTAQVGSELYRPTFHYTPRQNWMNDPSGLVYYNGKYHLFYLYNPSGAEPNNISWG